MFSTQRVTMKTFLFRNNGFQKGLQTHQLNSFVFVWFSYLYWSRHYWLYSIYIAFNLGFHLYLYFSYQLYLCARQKWKGLQSRALLRWSVLLSAAPPFLLRWEDTDEDNRFSLCICICISFLLLHWLCTAHYLKWYYFLFKRRWGIPGPLFPPISTIPIKKMVIRLWSDNV